MKKYKLLASLCVSAIFCFPRLDCEAPKLQIVTEEWAPYNYMENGALTGFSVEIVTEIMAIIGKKYEISLLPGIRGKTKLTNEKNILMITLFRTPEREGLYKWIGPIDNGSIYFYKRSDDPIAITTIEDAKKVKLISCRYTGLIPDLLRALNFTNLDAEAKDSMQVYKKLLLGRGDLGISDTELGVIYYLKKMGYPISSLTKTPVKIFEADLYIACSKDIPDTTVAEWQAALDQLKRSHTFEKLHAKYTH